LAILGQKKITTQKQFLPFFVLQGQRANKENKSQFSQKKKKNCPEKNCLSNKNNG